MAAAFRPPRSLQPETTPGLLRRGGGWNGARGVARQPAAGSRQAPQIHAHSWVETWPTPASAASDPDGSCRRRANPHHPRAHQLMSVLPAPAAPKGAAAALPDASTAAGDGRWPPKAALLIVLPGDRQIRPAETRTAFASTRAAASPGVSGATPRTRPSRLPHPATNQSCRPPSDRRHRGWRQLNGCRHDRLSPAARARPRHTIHKLTAGFQPLIQAPIERIIRPLPRTARVGLTTGLHTQDVTDDGGQANAPGGSQSTRSRGHTPQAPAGIDRFQASLSRASPEDAAGTARAIGSKRSKQLACHCPPWCRSQQGRQAA